MNRPPDRRKAESRVAAAPSENDNDSAYDSKDSESQRSQQGVAVCCAHAACTCTGAAVDYYSRCATCRYFLDCDRRNRENQRIFGMSPRQPDRLAAHIERIERRLRKIENALAAHGIE